METLVAAREMCFGGCTIVLYNKVLSLEFYK
jgi:hypothetical protein